MTASGTSIGQRIAADFEELRAHEKRHPSEVDAIVCAIVAHLRSWKPESVSPLGTLPEPGEANRDPRGPL